MKDGGMVIGLPPDHTLLKDGNLILFSPVWLRRTCPTKDQVLGTNTGHNGRDAVWK